MWIESEGRVAVRARSQGHCEADPAHSGTHVHHRKLRSQGGTWDPVNLLHLCTRCHQLVHANPRAGHQLGYLVPGHVDPERVPVWLCRPWAGWFMLTHAGDGGPHVLVPAGGVAPVRGLGDSWD